MNVAKHADPNKKALFGAAKEVNILTKHLGTEIIGLQLSDLDDKQKYESALLVAERASSEITIYLLRSN